MKGSRLSHFARLRWSYPVMFVIWIVAASFAAGPAVIASSALAPAPGPDPGGALLLEAVFAARGAIGASAVAMISALLILWLASPLLSMAWLNALCRPSTLSDAMARGARRYVSAVLSTIALVPVLLVALGLGAAFVWAADLALEDASAVAHDLGVMLSALPGLGALALWATWHDLARARLAVGSEGAWRATRGAFTALRLGSVARYAGFFLVALAIGALGLFATGVVDSGAAVVIGQLFVLGRLTVRGLYLAGLVAR